MAITPDKKKDLNDFQMLVGRLQVEGRKQMDPSSEDALTDLLGGEKLPHKTRSIVKEMDAILDDNPEFEKLVPTNLKEYWELAGIKKEWKKASLRRLAGDIASVIGELSSEVRIATSPHEGNSLEGMSKVTAKRHLNQLLRNYTKGFFSDNSWEAVDKIFKAMSAAQIDWTLEGTQYREDNHGVPISKEWRFKVEFNNERGRPSTLFGIIVASGAGSVTDPLEKYDLTAYAS